MRRCGREHTTLAQLSGAFSARRRRAGGCEPAKLVDTVLAQNLIYAPRRTAHARVKSGVAQLVEQLTVNQLVTGSSPVRGAKSKVTSLTASGFFYCANVPDFLAYPLQSGTVPL